MIFTPDTMVEKLHKNGKDFLILIQKDEDGIFHSQLHEIASAMHSDKNDDIDKLLETAHEKIQAHFLVDSIK
jgi:hypothetical protein